MRIGPPQRLFLGRLRGLFLGGMRGLFLGGMRGLFLGGMRRLFLGRSRGLFLGGVGGGGEKSSAGAAMRAALRARQALCAVQCMTPR